MDTVKITPIAYRLAEMHKLVTLGSMDHAVRRALLEDIEELQRLVVEVE